MKDNLEPLQERFTRAQTLVPKIIGSAIEVHRHWGPGLNEEIYENSLLHELSLQNIPAQQQLRIPVRYKNITFETPLRLDILVDSCLIVELKVVETLMPAHKAQLLSYMKLLRTPVGLLINFHEPILKNGLRKLTLRECLPTKPTSEISMISL
jgi:GxxExxY protein